MSRLQCFIILGRTEKYSLETLLVDESYFEIWLGLCSCGYCSVTLLLAIPVMFVFEVALRIKVVLWAGILIMLWFFVVCGRVSKILRASVGD